MESINITPEQEKSILDFENKMKAFYEERLPFIRIKHEHDVMQMEISEARLRTVQADDKFMAYQKMKDDLRKDSENENNKKDGSNKDTKNDQTQ